MGLFVVANRVREWLTKEHMPHRRALALLASLAVLVSGCANSEPTARSSGSAESVADGPPAAVGGVVFVHGTATYTQESAVTDYWTEASLTTMSAGYPYLAVGYAGDTCAAFDECSWGDIASQIDAWLDATGVTRIVIVTHSNGANPVRFMVHHPTASDAVQRVAAATSQVVFLAGDSAGTPLADEVTEGGTFASVVNSVLDTFGFGTYDNPAVWQQRTDSMAQYDSDGTFDDANGDQGGTTLAGVVPVMASSGTSVDAIPFTNLADCGGYEETAGLEATLLYGWGESGCADGFIGCDSSQYVGFNPQAGLGFEGDTLNHNQSRRSCDGVGGWVASAVGQGLSLTSAALSLRFANGANERTFATATRAILASSRSSARTVLSQTARLPLHAGVPTRIAVDSTERAELFVVGGTTGVNAPGGSKLDARMSRIAGTGGAVMTMASLSAADEVGAYVLRSRGEGVLLARFPASPIALTVSVPEGPIVMGESSGPAVRVQVTDGGRAVDGATIAADLVADGGRTRAPLAVREDGVGSWAVDVSAVLAPGQAEGIRHIETSVHGASRGREFDRFAVAAVSVVRRTARVTDARVDGCDGESCSVSVEVDASEAEQQEITVRLMESTGRLLAGRGQSSVQAPQGSYRHVLHIPSPAGATLADVRVYSVGRHALLDRWAPAR